MVTLPVGLLRDGRFRLDPLPPPAQWAAINRLGYGAGVLAKIYMRFPHVFWPEKSKWFGRLPDAPDRRGTFNTFVSHTEETGLPILLSFANGHSAVRYERDMGDEEVKQAALASLRKMFGHNKVPEPEAFVFPRWLTDPWTMGGYTYPAIGSPPEDHDDHARPLANRVFFAGEGTEPVEYGTVHAALWSAEMAAEAIFELVDRRATHERPSSVGRRAARGGACYNAEVMKLASILFVLVIVSGSGHARRAVRRTDQHGARPDRQRRAGAPQQQADVVARAPAASDHRADPAVVPREQGLMVKLTRIYTKGGDKGQTSLGRGERVAKHDLRVEAYGTVDETNSVIGLARAIVERTVKNDAHRRHVDDMLARIQNDLFDLGADLCTVKAKRGQPALRIVPAQVERLEREIDEMNAELGPLTSFILPGGSEASAWLHLAPHRGAPRRAAHDAARGQADGQSRGDQVHQPPLRPPVRARPAAQRQRCSRRAVGARRPIARNCDGVAGVTSPCPSRNLRSRMIVDRLIAADINVDRLAVEDDGRRRCASPASLPLRRRRPRALAALGDAQAAGIACDACHRGAAAGAGRPTARSPTPISAIRRSPPETDRAAAALLSS